MIQPKNSNLIEITTPIQSKRGNRQFFDKHHCVSYITYSNGYVRREIKSIYTNPHNGKQYKMQDQFVINKRKCTKHSYKTTHGYEYSYTSTSVIKEPCPQKRMDIIDRISSNYKGYTGRLCKFGYFLIPK